ncbi:MAG: hypothetical protein VB020_00715 [Methanocorpusculum sp.]|nr:hypothetical protein [Methanocorpusculum sp.]
MKDELPGKITAMRQNAYLNITPEEFQTLNSIAENLGFLSRTDLFTACAHLLIYGKAADGEPSLDPVTEKELKNLHELNKKHLLQMQTFMQILDEIALPVIAMRGTGVVLSSLGHDIKLLMLERCGMVPEDIDIRDWLKIYKNTRRSHIIEYRTKQFASIIKREGE